MAWRRPIVQCVRMPTRALQPAPPGRPHCDKFVARDASPAHWRFGRSTLRMLAVHTTPTAMCVMVAWPAAHAPLHPPPPGALGQRRDVEYYHSPQRQPPTTAATESPADVSREVVSTGIPLSMPLSVLVPVRAGRCPIVPTGIPSRPVTCKGSLRRVHTVHAFTQALLLLSPLLRILRPHSLAT